MQFKAINRGSTTEIVITQIKEQIKNGSLKPGAKLPSERSLAEMLGISRTSVREAIQALAFSGYLNVMQGKGIFVADSAPKYEEIIALFTKISDFNLNHIMEVRILIESGFARLAAQRATPEDIAKIENSYTELKKSETTRMHFIKDLELHAHIAKATHNPIMGSLMHVIGEKLHAETNNLINLSAKAQSRTVKVMGELIEAIKNRDHHAAQKLMVDHLQNIENLMEEELP